MAVVGSGGTGAFLCVPLLSPILPFTSPPLHLTTVHPFPVHPNAQVSSWQTAHRKIVSTAP
jgi:hypothetical protein